MVSKVYTILAADNRHAVYHHAVWDRSPRVNGKIKLRPNALNPYRHHVEKRFTKVNKGIWTLPNPAWCEDNALNMYGNEWIPCNNAALAKFNGKLKKGGASLGVTLASWGQSRDMIASRYAKLTNAFSEVERRLSNRKKPFPNRVKDSSELRASDVLEYEFGWVPLVSDIKAALTTVCDVPDSPWVRGSHTVDCTWGYKDGDGVNSAFHTFSRVGKYRCTVAGQCTITNPNLYLLNRMGLINPGTVIWDLVPWSFVVNMFVNANQMIGSLTDYVGLSITGGNMTRSASFSTYESYTTYDPKSNYKGLTAASQVHTQKVRTLGIPTPSLQFTAPQVSFETIVIASSLFVQQLGRITKIANGLIR